MKNFNLKLCPYFIFMPVYVLISPKSYFYMFFDLIILSWKLYSNLVSISHACRLRLDFKSYSSNIIKFRFVLHKFWRKYLPANARYNFVRLRERCFILSALACTSEKINIIEEKVTEINGRELQKKKVFKNFNRLYITNYIYILSSFQKKISGIGLAFVLLPG